MYTFITKVTTNNSVNILDIYPSVDQIFQSLETNNIPVIIEPGIFDNIIFQPYAILAKDSAIAAITNSGFIEARRFVSTDNKTLYSIQTFDTVEKGEEWSNASNLQSLMSARNAFCDIIAVESDTKTTTSDITTYEEAVVAFDSGQPVT